MNELLTKAQGSTGDSPKQSVASLTAYSEPERRETPDYKHEIQRVEAKLEEFFRRMDARINDLARRNQSVKNRQDSAHENDGLFVTRVGELVMYSKIVIRGLHVNQVRILSGTSQTTNIAKKAEVILHAPVIISHNEETNYPL